MTGLNVLAESRDEPVPLQRPAGRGCRAAAGERAAEGARRGRRVHGAAGGRDARAGVPRRRVDARARRGMQTRATCTSRGLQAVLNHVHANLAGDLSAARAWPRARGRRHWRISAGCSAVPWGCRRTSTCWRRVLDLARRAADAIHAARRAGRAGVRLRTPQSHLTACFPGGALDHAGPVPGSPAVANCEWPLATGPRELPIRADAGGCVAVTGCDGQLRADQWRSTAQALTDP
ncbi:MAG: hypothetical protein MZU91_12195 [Desulfosudis oleivorans]|nr:hypothetical protein [Desulfosudis oleivorans]